MNAVVLGAGGFLGHHVCSELASAGHSLVRVGRRARAPGDVEVDLFDPTLDLGALLAGSEACIHLACDLVPATAEQAGWEGVARNVALAYRVADACVEAGVGTLVFASSGGTVYGAVAEGAKEGDACAPIGLYGALKVAAEGVLHARLAGKGTRLVVLRVGNPFGPGQEARRIHGVVGRIFEALIDDAPFTVWGDGRQVRDYVPVADAARAFRLATEQPSARGVFNIGSGAGVTMDELIARCSAIAGRTLRYSLRPKAPFEVDRVYLDVSRAARELGWSPSSGLDDGLHHYFRYLLESH